MKQSSDGNERNRDDFRTLEQDALRLARRFCADANISRLDGLDAHARMLQDRASILRGLVDHARKSADPGALDELASLVDHWLISP